MGLKDSIFFAKVFRDATGFDPYPYQERLATAEELPSRLSVPTGLGKTAAVVLSWLWRRRLTPDEAVRRATPRRLVYCLPMRVLVEQTEGCCRSWLGKLDLLAEKAPKEHPEDKVAVHVLMGGDLEIDWDNWPERDQILIGTQDMLLSRALNRGYAMSRFRWPIHFGLLNNDCLWVMDEVQLMGPGLATTAQFEGLRRRFSTGKPTRSLWLSATLDPSWIDTVDLRPYLPELKPGGLEDDDRGQDHVDRLLSAPKSLARAGVKLTDENSKGGHKDYVAALADEVAVRHRSGKTTLVIVNQVERSQALTVELSGRKLEAEILLVHSRFRPPERRELEARLREPPPPDGRIVVATQAVEAGVDMTSAVLVTELAPWPSIVQRCGRCNRYREEEDSEIFWIDIELEAKGLHLPYSPEELAEAREKLEELDSASPGNLPPVTSGPPNSMVLRARDLVELFDTDPDLSGFDVDVSPYIREADDREVQVFWREFGNEPEKHEPRPWRDELCSASLGQLRAFLKKVVKKKPRRAWIWDNLDGRWRRLKEEQIRPGLVIMAEDALGGYDPDLGFNPKYTGAVTTISKFDEPPESYTGDQRSSPGFFVTLMDHLGDVEGAMDGLLRSLGGFEDRVLQLAACWHDTGKSHPVFQATMTSCLDEDDRRRLGLWAKSICHSKHERPGFRHELASMLAWLEHHDGDPDADLVAYLIAAHHGRVRLGLRALPTEKEAPDGRRFARGIWEGDKLPELELANGERVPETTLRLELMELGLGPQGPSWTSRTRRLLIEHGPFRLAWLETLLRIADWRGSALETEGDHDA